MDTSGISNRNLAAAASFLGNLDPDSRMRAVKALASEAGLRMPETILPEGTALLQIGEDKRRALVSEIAKLPDFVDGMAALRAVIAAERSKDIETPVQKIRMAPDTGRLYGDGHRTDSALGYTDAGFRHAWGMVQPPTVRGGADLMLALPEPIRALAWDELAKRSTRAADDGAVLRTIVNPGSGARVIRAVVTQRHSQETGDDGAVLSALAKMDGIANGAKLRVTRTFDRTDLEVIWSLADREIKVGDVVKACAHISNSETKAGSLRVAAKILRVQCYNFTTAYSEGGDEDIALRHIGDLGPRLAEALARAIKRVEPFVLAFGDAYGKAFPDFAPTRGELVERFVRRFGLPEAFGQATIATWDEQNNGGDSLAGLVHAFTRASQDLDMANAERIESIAGRAIVRGWDVLDGA